jgi:hypothetical protein
MVDLARKLGFSIKMDRDDPSVMIVTRALHVIVGGSRDERRSSAVRGLCYARSEDTLVTILDSAVRQPPHCARDNNAQPRRSSATRARKEGEEAT